VRPASDSVTAMSRWGANSRPNSLASVVPPRIKMCFRMLPAEATDPQTAALRAWLSIVGIGEDGVEALSGAARECIRSAAVVFGGARHLSLAASLIRGIARPWSVPFDESVAEVLKLRGRPVCVLASGDPFFHGVGSLLSRQVRAEEMVSLPTQSAFSLAASRLLWPIPNTILLSLCGRSLDLIRPHLHSGTRILALTSDQRAPRELAHLLSDIGFGCSRITVLECLAGPKERIRVTQADRFDMQDIDALNTVAIEVAAETNARILSRAAGLADELFEHDGQLTKREIRALTLSALAPRRGELLWDVGAGAGSIAIEWMLADVSLNAIAIEQRSDRAARLMRNAAAFGVPNMKLVEGSAPSALADLAMPDAVFIGGGATAPGVVDGARSALRPGGRLVVNAVTLESEAVLLKCKSQWGGSLTHIAISRADPIGTENARLSGWRPSMPVIQWTWTKPR
jgi:precorrin-6Y C5,15-methyltransferase (decarboxylating)